MTFKNNLKGYRIAYSNQAQKAIKKLSKNIASKIVEKLSDLVSGNENLDVKKLSGYEDARYRLRVGDYRIIYAVWEHQVVVYIIEVGHRREIYRD